MPIDDALQSAARVLRRQTSTVLPYYALLAASVDVARLPLLAGVAVVYMLLTSTGRLDPLVEELAAVNPERLDPANPTGLPPELGSRLAETFFSPSVVLTLVASVVAGFLVFVLARGVARAAALSAVAAGLDGRDPLAAGVAGTGRWRTFVGIALLRWALLVVAALPVVFAVLGSLGTLGSGSPGDAQTVAAVLAALAGIAITLVVALAVVVLLAFAGPAAVVDDVGLGGAVRRSVSVPFTHPGSFLLYVLVVISVSVAAGLVAGVVSLAGVDRLAALVTGFVVTPFLDAVAVALYLGWSEESTVADTDAATVGDSTEATTDTDAATSVATSATETDVSWPDPQPRRSRWVGVVDALSALGAFVRTELRYIAVAAAILAGGGGAGWAATVGYGVRFTPPGDPATVFGAIPVAPFVNIAVNNSLVAMTAGFSGVFAGLPTVGTLLFNGLLVGAVAGVVDPLAFAALVAPHGVVELPAIAVAGGVGLKVGHVSWDVWRGRRSRDDLSSEIGRAWRVLVGLVVVFVLAAFVEAFVTPQVAAAVLSG